jgi:hypothetical protein
VTKVGARVLTAEAGGTATAQAVAEGLTRAVSAAGERPELEDVRPLPENDSRGMAGYFPTVGVVIGSLAAAIALWLFAPRLGLLPQLGALAGFAALGGLLAAATTAGIVDTLDGAYWSVAGVTAVLSLAVGLTAAALVRWSGSAGIGASILVLVAVGLSSSGGVFSPTFLPGFFDAVGPLMPPGAGRDALRAVVYFDGHGAADALAPLLAWALVGAGGLLAATRARRWARPALPLSARPAPTSPS